MSDGDIVSAEATSGSEESVIGTSVSEAVAETEIDPDSDEQNLAHASSCHAGHPVLHRDNSWENLDRPRTCKLSATLKKRSHNHYIPSCMNLTQISVVVGEVSINLQEIAHLVAEYNDADEASASNSNESSPSAAVAAAVATSGAGGDSHLDAKEMASLTTMLKEVRVNMTVKSNGAEWQIVRHLHQLIEFDEWLHKCCLQRSAKYNNLFDLRQTFAQSYRSFSPSNLTAKKQMEIILQYYFRCFSSLSGQQDFCSKLVCPLALDILDIDCKGNRQSLADRYNTQGIELAVAVRDFKPACEDELALNCGDYVAVTYVSVNVDSPTWWEGKIVPKEELEKDAPVSCEDSLLGGAGCCFTDGGSRASLQRRRRIGFFPSNCVRIVGPGDTPASVTRKEQQMAMQSSTDEELMHAKKSSPVTQQQQQQQLQQQQQEQTPGPVRAKYPRLLDSLRAFFRSRPDPNQLRRTGILRNGIFGSDLASYLGEYNLDYPPVLVYCANLIESHGTCHEGLYRKCGNGLEVQRLMQIFEYGNQPDDVCTCVRAGPVTITSDPFNRSKPSVGGADTGTKMVESTEPTADKPTADDTVASAPTNETVGEDALTASSQAPMCPYRSAMHNYTNLLKTYFRELAEPLLSDRFTACQPEFNQLRDCVAQMSPVHFRVAQYLFNHLHRVSGHTKRTLMHSHNLALVWAPNLCQQPPIGTGSNGLMEAARISQHQANIVACIIDNCHELFVQATAQTSSNRVVLDVIMPVQIAMTRGFDRGNPFAASIRRNSSSASSNNAAAAGATGSLASLTGASNAGSKSNRWAKARAVKQLQKQQQQQQQHLKPAKLPKKLQRRSASDEDGSNSATPPPPISPALPPPTPPSAAQSTAALDLSTVKTNIEAGEEPADLDCLPKFSVRKAIPTSVGSGGGGGDGGGRGAGGGGRGVCRAISNAAPKLTIKKAAEPRHPPGLTRGDSVVSNFSTASSMRLLPGHQQQQQQQQQH